jgi:hypothetical protein
LNSKLWKNETFQTVLVIAAIMVVVFGFWFGSQLVLNTKIPPALAVVSGSMCIPYDGACDGWSHPFDRTLHVGDIVIIQGINPDDLNANYPNSDIIVFQRPDMSADNPNGKIVHRIVSEIEVNGTLYFYTKGDGNPRYVWPNTPQPTDYWAPDPTDPSSTYEGAVSQDYVYGKVIMRVPWLGWVSILMHDWGGNSAYGLVPIVAVLIILLIVVELAVPLLKKHKQQPTLL